jgi:hypothetical protein
LFHSKIILLIGIVLCLGTIQNDLAESLAIVPGTIPKVSIVANSATSTGLEWQAPAGGGKVLQVVTAVTTTATTIASNSLTDTGITATITPTSATSKILVLISSSTMVARSSTTIYAKYQVLRDATQIWNATNNDIAFGLEATGTTYVRMDSQLGITYLDSPATTSATTYKVQAATANTADGGAVYYQVSGNTSTIT